MKNHNYSTVLCISVFTLFFFSCKKDSVPSTPAPKVVKSWMVNMSSKFEVPANAARTETGMAMIDLLSDNSLKYTLTVTGLASGDALTNSHIHVGNVLTSAGVILDLKPTFANSSATGTVTDLRASFVDSLKSDLNDLYVNIHSTQLPGGLIRGQLNKTIDVAADVVMTPANEVPAGTTTATGLAIIRVTSDKQMYVKVTVSNLEATDALTAAHIHKAAAGVNAGVMVGFYGAAADFGTVKIVTLDDASYASMKVDALYVNAHSTAKPAGLIRGQIR
jgi:hypothetical protein